MKVVIIISLFVIKLFSAPPIWYINQSIENKKYEIIGYKEEKTLSEAKQFAKNNIVKSIQTKLSSNTSIIKVVKYGSYSKNITQNINGNLKLNFKKDNTL